MRKNTAHAWLLCAIAVTLTCTMVLGETNAEKIITTEAEADVQLSRSHALPLITLRNVGLDADTQTAARDNSKTKASGASQPFPDTISITLPCHETDACSAVNNHHGGGNSGAAEHNQLHLDLQRVQVVAHDYTETQVNDDLGMVTIQGRREHHECFYRGTIRGQPHSSVSVSLCQGIRGALHIRPPLGATAASATDEPPATAAHVTFDIVPKRAHLDAMVDTILQELDEPRPRHQAVLSMKALSTLPHVIRRTDFSPLKALGKNFCTTTHTEQAGDDDGQSWTSDEHHRHGPSTSTAQPRLAVDSRHGSEIHSPQFGRINNYLIELVIINDYALYQRLGTLTEQNSIDIFHRMASFYQGDSAFPNLLLSGQVTYTRTDPFRPSRTSDGGVEVTGRTGLLDLTNSFRTSHLNSLPRHDGLQLFSGRNFRSNIMGVAGIGSMCMPGESASIVQATLPSVTLNAVLAAHELGHMIAAEHDGYGNRCASSGYIMASYASSASTFSPCSRSYVRRFVTNKGSYCLQQKSSSTLSLLQSPAHNIISGNNDVSSVSPSIKNVHGSPNQFNDAQEPSGQAHWILSSWSDCSWPCGGGIQSRALTCIIEDTTGERDASSMLCDPLTKPEVPLVRPCNTHRCDLDPKVIYSCLSMSLAIVLGIVIACLTWKKQGIKDPQPVHQKHVHFPPNTLPEVSQTPTITKQGAAGGKVRKDMLTAAMNAAHKTVAEAASPNLTLPPVTMHTNNHRGTFDVESPPPSLKGRAELLNILRNTTLNKTGPNKP